MSEVRNSTDVSTRVVDALADVAEADPTDIPPLYDTVDPDALDRFFTPLADTDGTAAATVEFHHAGFHVTVTHDHDVTVTPDE